MSADQVPDPVGEAARQARNANWAAPVTRLGRANVAEGAGDLNVAGRRLSSPLQGFGQLWQKTYRLAQPAASEAANRTPTPAEVIAAWKDHYADFWPKGNRFYAPITGISPGEVGVIRSAQGPMQLSTGVMVLYADDVSFTFMTPEGHPFAGWITFSAEEGPAIGAQAARATLVQIQLLIRASDPIYETMFKLGFGKVEDRMWQHTLEALAAFFGAADAEVETSFVCVDRRRQWSHVRNVWQNAGVRTALHTAGAPARWLARPFRRHA
jgi:hypothetical protein